MKKTASTKDEILHLLKRYKKMSVVDLETHLEITGMAVRRHLNNLENERMIQSETIRKNMGRPVQLYSLTKIGEGHFPKSYSNMTVEFLEDIEAINGPEMIDVLFQNRETRMEAKYKARIEQNDLKDRVAELAKIQNENGYMVDWEEKEEGVFELIEYNCPIFEVARKYPKACSCEQSLFQKVLQTDEIEQVCCMSKGGDHCKYLIKVADNNE
ncbi:helix-turn-helix transcriptional regulator [Heyndrickxia oleronia]|uniref:HTH arsR-type domain-containing protein n=1 Tax=Heyndrickxia oleronia TaxID=38875 RepID=A0A8E2I9E5_9BACI|nr:metalloregulator ArsR/SmtB family transcription factor [Heyndrickxia oleronia]MCI1590078.1 transcriptional regulator [Heyndrickxia oleronia]MCI1613769.1 transcriptional regulator [Heyndrickxia oleronia]MCI1744899.1 transcriptional regulator [Heyndrickxia oleronia]MCI1761714.1 transcriptional regulator [Heyndrickxia oleronia]MEC1376264.1 transcriptional regulator [Heyndrickxia oleronia]